MRDLDALTEDELGDELVRVNEEVAEVADALGRVGMAAAALTYDLLGSQPLSDDDRRRYMDVVEEFRRERARDASRTDTAPRVN